MNDQLCWLFNILMLTEPHIQSINRHQNSFNQSPDNQEILIIQNLRHLMIPHKLELGGLKVVKFSIWKRYPKGIPLCSVVQFAYNSRNTTLLVRTEVSTGQSDKPAPVQPHACQINSMFLYKHSPIRSDPLCGSCMMIYVVQSSSRGPSLFPALWKIFWATKITQWIHHRIMTSSCHTSMAIPW